MHASVRDQNAIRPLTKRCFPELSGRERDHLQERIAKRSKALGDFLIIQKEFAEDETTSGAEAARHIRRRRYWDTLLLRAAQKEHELHRDKSQGREKNG